MFLLESPQQGNSNEYTQYTIFQYKKENHPKLSQICNYGICSKGLKNKFKTAVVNEPSVFEPLNFCCIYFQEAQEIADAYENYKDEMSDLAETVEIATLDKEMAEEKV